MADLKNEPFVGVLVPDYIFVGCPSRVDFDRIGLPLREHERVLVKSLEHDGVTVVFQHWFATAGRLDREVSHG